MGVGIIQANTMDMPTIEYDAPRLRDSTMRGETGITIMEKTAAAMAQQPISLLRRSDPLSNYNRDALWILKAIQLEQYLEFI